MEQGKRNCFSKGWERVRLARSLPLDLTRINPNFKLTRQLCESSCLVDENCKKLGPEDWSIGPDTLSMLKFTSIIQSHLLTLATLKISQHTPDTPVSVVHIDASNKSDTGAFIDPEGLKLSSLVIVIISNLLLQHLGGDSTFPGVVIPTVFSALVVIKARVFCNV
ncbi:hypothetical protein Ac2012v2_007938 [Leucoagaricus gongylophorus]